MRLLVSVLVSLLAASCSTIPGKELARVNLPQPDKRLVDPYWCGNTKIEAGMPLLLIAKNKERERACERSRVIEWNKFYDQLRYGLSNK